MMRMLIGGLALLVVGLLSGSARAVEQVVVYTSEDQVFSEPILNAFEAKNRHHGQSRVRHGGDQKHRGRQPSDG
jgi:hypothetical protein